MIPFRARDPELFRLPVVFSLPFSIAYLEAKNGRRSSGFMSLYIRSRRISMCVTLKSLRACIVIVLVCSFVGAQSTNSTPSPVVPPLVKFSGVLTDVNSKTLTGTVGVTFSLYNEAQGGTALWVETQNVTPDKAGHYSVMLGSTTMEGIPASLFGSGEARWLGVQAQGQTEQPRTMLMSVPYALKALDAETIGGKPASSFMLTPQAGGKASAPGKLPPGTITGSGTADYIPMFTGATTIGNSHIFQTVGGNVGIGNTAPAAKLDVKGTEDVRNTLTLFPSGTNPALSLHGTALEVSSAGKVTFVSGQTFPGTGSVSSVGLSAPSSDFTVSGSPITGSGTLGLSWTVAPTPNDTASAIVKRDGSGNIQVSSITATSSSSNPVLGQDTYSGTSSAGVTGRSTNGTGVVGSGPTGVYGASSSSSGNGVYGTGDVGVDGNGVDYGVVGSASSSTGYGVYGAGDSGVVANGNTYGVNATATTYGVYASANAGDGVLGVSNSGSGNGVVGRASGGTGVYGSATTGNGVFGTENSGGYGVYGESTSSNGVGVVGLADNSGGAGGAFYNDSTGDALFVYEQSGGDAAFLEGNVDVDGNLSKAGGSFKIDHPLDPANKYLYHSFVESPDMKNIYDGVATLNANGEATIEMPDWFGVLNRDFRYQLTCIGGFAPVYIAEELANNQFKIGGGRAGMRISWQITGIRQDAWANAHRIPVEQEKEAKLKGFYLHPELYGAPAEKQVQWARHPEIMKKLQQNRGQMKEKQARPPESATIAAQARPVPPLILEKPAPLIPPSPLPHRATK
jgi:hypothetical protein